MSYDYTVWAKRLKSANIPQNERLKILKIGGDLINSGVSKEDIEKLIKEVTTSYEFKTLILENPKEALSKLGI
ncbi:MAG: hypothetical protein ACTSRG_21190 [Candidatus Helarchaeota archaeon]